MMKNKFFLIFIISSFYSNLYCQERIVSKNTPASGTQTITARDAIYLKPGFLYNSTSGTLNTDFNSSLSVPTEYLTQTPDPENRVLSTTANVGLSTGSANITPLGSATYQLPINVPQGIAGIQPNLSIVYNSFGADGLLGSKFSLTGVSAITRISSNFETDDAIYGVQFNLTDKFAIDGNRLIKTNGDVYGTSGTVYETEVKSFAKIESFGEVWDGGILRGPLYFKVQTKEGKTIEYGATSDSRLKIGGLNTPIQYRINKISDIHGNYMTFTYAIICNESVLSEIDYTGTSSGDAPYAKIRFFYQLRNDISKRYISGKLYQNSAILEKIEIFSENTFVRRYSFNYTYNNLKTQLIGVKEEASNNTEFNETIFKWGNESNVIVTEDITQKMSTYGIDWVNSNCKTTVTANFYNAGKTDLINIREYNGSTYYSIYKNYFPEYSFISGQNFSFSIPHIHDYYSKIIYNPIACNLNDNPKNEFIIPFWNKTNNTLNFRIYWDLTQSYNDYSFTITNSTDDPVFTFSDVNADGINELLFVKSNNNEHKLTFCSLNNLSNNLIAEYLLHPPFYSIPKQIFVADLNADGLRDVFITTENGFVIYKFNDIGSSSINDFDYTLLQGTNIKGDNDFMEMGDFNGDGLPDLIYNKHYSTTWQMALNNGNFSFTIKNLPNITSHSADWPTNEVKIDSRFVYDINNDGKSDLVIIDADYHKLNGYQQDSIIWYYSNGNGFTKIASKKIVDENYALKKNIYLGNFNGDEKVQLLNYGSDLYGANVKDTKFRLYYVNKNYDFGMITSIADANNIVNKITYFPLTSQNKPNNILYYNPSSNTDTYTCFQLTPALNCVSEIKISNGFGGYSNIDYSYKGARYHLNKGFIGFDEISVTNDVLNIKTITNNVFNNDNGFLLNQTILQKTTSGVNVASTTNNYTTTKNGNLYSIFLASSISTDYLKSITSTTVNTYDANYGNITSSQIDYGAGFSKSVVYSDYVNAGSWIPSKPQTVTNSQKHPDDPNSFSKTSKYTFNSVTGDITSHIENFGISGKEVLTTYNSYTSEGFPTSITITAQSEGGAINKSKSFTYSNNSRFLLSETSDFGTKYYTYNTVNGNVLTYKDEVNRTTTYTYNSLGRLIGTNIPGNFNASRTIERVTSSGPANAFLLETNNSTGNPWQKTWYDVLGRTLRTETLGYNDMSIYTNYNYSNKGQLIKQSTFAGGTLTSEIIYEYDDFGRVSSQRSNSNSNITYSYANKSITVNDNGAVYTKVFDNWGLTKSVTEPSPGTTINYSYYSSGNAKAITSNGSIVNMGYDALGYQTSLQDPSSGTTIYRFDPIGRLTYQKDANNKEIKLIYDAFGNLISKTDGAGQIINSYEYYTDGFAKGLVKKITAQNGSWDSFEYDYLGREIKSTRHIDASISDIIFTTEYDSYGNVSKITYPGNYVITQEYDTYGNLKKVLNGTTTLWQLNTNNVSTYSYTLGNGLSTTKTFNSSGFIESIVTSNQVQSLYYTFHNPTGILQSREDRRTGYNLKETFFYDNLDRLYNWSIYKNNILTETKSITYTNEKITQKTDIGTYDYSGTKPHAVNAINPGTTGYLPLQQDITYTDFGKVNTITENGNQLVITYGQDNQRIKSQLTNNGVPVNTKYYAGLYEVEKDANGNTKEYLYIPTGDGISIVVVKSPSGTQLYYIHKDYLGSIVALTNSNGAIVEQMNYDPWGRFRNVSTWTNTNVVLPTILTRGYTGHEHLNQFNLINMNGRVYDPMLGLFLSPDNYIQDPDKSQNYNRYSYCLNNPLMYTDPTGEFWDRVIVGAIGFAVGYTSYGLINDDWGWKAVGSGAISAASFMLGYYASGSAGMASTFLAAEGAGSGYAATVALGYSGRMAASSVISSILPSASINIGNATLGVSPAFMIGSGGYSVGLNLQASYNAGDFTFGGALGTSYGKSGFTSITGSETRLSGFAGYDNGNFGIGFSSTQFWSGETSQRLGRLSMRYNDFSMSYENDGTPFQYFRLAGGTDSYRTASVTLGYKDFTIGMLLFTGYRDYNAVDYSDPENYPYGMVSNPEINKYNAGILYAGYGNMRAGWNHDNIRHLFQNRGAHGGYPTKQAWIPRKNWPNQPYLVYGANNPYTNW